MTNLLKTYPVLALLLGVVGLTALTAAAIALHDRGDRHTPSSPDATENPSFKPYTTTGKDAKKTQQHRKTPHKKPTTVTQTTPSPKETTVAESQPSASLTSAGVGNEPRLAEVIVIDGKNTPFGPADAIEGHPEPPEEPVVLGPSQWRAQLPGETQQKLDLEIEQKQRMIDRALERRVREHDLRRGGGQLVQENSWRCYRQLLQAEPDARGRLQVSVQLVGEGGVGTIEHARIKSSVYLKQPSLHDCIVRSLIGATFETTAVSNTIINTEYPVGLPTLELQ